MCVLGLAHLHDVASSVEGVTGAYWDLDCDLFALHPWGLQGLLNFEGRLSEKAIWRGYFLLGKASSAAYMVLNRKYTPILGLHIRTVPLFAKFKTYIYSRKTVGGKEAWWRGTHGCKQSSCNLLTSRWRLVLSDHSEFLEVWEIWMGLLSSTHTQLKIYHRL